MAVPGIEFRMLGPLEVRVDGRVVGVGGPRQRALLAMLLLSANRAVSQDRLIAELLADAPTRTAGRALRVQVSRLRKVLAADGTESRLVARPPGYLLRVEPGELDLDTFEEDVDKARRARDGGDLELAASLLRSAESLWRGAPLADLEFEPFARIDTERLTQLRETAVEDRIDVELALGRHVQLLPELEALVAEHPLRERLRGQLMLALYRCGQQAAALEVYRAGRAQLSAELALEPGPELRRLEHSILRQEPNLELASAPLQVATELPSPRIAPDTVGPQPPVPTDPATPSGPGRRRRAVIATAITALGVLIAALVSFVAYGGRSAALPFIGTDALGRIAIGSGQLVGRVSVGAGPAGVATDGRSLWIANTLDGTVSRIDLRNPGAPSNAIALSGRPGGLSAPAGVTTGFGAVWVTDANNRTLDRIDPADNEIVDHITVGNGPVSAVAGDGAIWVANSLDDTMSVVDPSTDRVVATVAVAADPVAVAVGFNAVWVANAGSGSVIRVDPRSRTPVASINVGAGPSAIACGGGAVWVANAFDGTVSRLDPAQDRVLSTVAVGRSPDGLALTGRSLWVTDGNADAISRVDVRTDQVTNVVPVGDTTAGAVVARGAVWVTASGSAAQHRGGTLRLLANSHQLLGVDYHETVDPGYAYQALIWELDSMTNDGLVAFRRTAGPTGSEIVPDLATTLPSPTDNGRTYTFTLRPGLRFSNGQPVTARDVRASFERTVATGALSRAPFAGEIVGASACQAHPGRPCDLAHGITLDEASGTVTFHLVAPDSAFLDTLAIPFADVLPAGEPRSDRGLAPLPATGPYVHSATRALPHGVDELVFTRNPYYRQWSVAAQPAGYPDRLELTVLPSSQDDPGKEAAAVVSGRYDWSAQGVGPQALPHLLLTHSALLHVDQLGETAYYFLNPHVYPFNDVRVRRAVNFGLDRRAAVAAAGGGLLGHPTCQVLPPTMTGYRPYCPYTIDPNGAGTWTAPDILRARQLVRAAGAIGAHVTIIGTRDEFIPADQVLRSDLVAIGLRASVRMVNPNAYYAFIGGTRNHVAAAITGWLVDYPAPSDMFLPLLTCSSVREANALNLGRFCDPRLDTVIHQAADEQQAEPAAAAGRWAVADRIATNDAPWVFLVNRRAVDILSSRTRNYEYQTELGVMLDQLWVR